MNPYLDSATEAHPSIGRHHHKRHQHSVSFRLLAYPTRQRQGPACRPRAAVRAPTAERGVSARAGPRKCAAQARARGRGAPSWDGRRRCRDDVFFAAQLPGGVHPDTFFAWDYGRVVVQLPHNYPAAAHFALFFTRDDRHRWHFDTFFAQQLPGGVHPGTFFARGYCRVVG